MLALDTVKSVSALPRILRVQTRMDPSSLPPKEPVPQKCRYHDRKVPMPISPENENKKFIEIGLMEARAKRHDRGRQREFRSRQSIDCSRQLHQAESCDLKTAY